jgi:cytoskeletal protein CcmA (bactofilin family)
MAFRKRNEEKGNVVIASPPSDRHETFRGEASVLSGHLRFAESVRIEGRIEGQIRADKRVIIAATAEVDATIEADVLEVYGTGVGDIRVRRNTTLHKTANVDSEIHTSGIVVEEGARFRGYIVIGPESEMDAPSMDCRVRSSGIEC